MRCFICTSPPPPVQTYGSWWWFWVTDDLWTFVADIKMATRWAKWDVKSGQEVNIHPGLLTIPALWSDDLLVMASMRRVTMISTTTRRVTMQADGTHWCRCGKPTLSSASANWTVNSVNIVHCTITSQQCVHDLQNTARIANSVTYKWKCCDCWSDLSFFTRDQKSLA